MGGRPEYRAAAEALAGELAARGIGLVFGGSCVGLMGTIADAMLSRGGEVIGVIPDALVAREVAHVGLSDLRVVRSMHERKAMMADLSDAFVAMPGGFGTVEEFSEVLTWSQLGFQQKRCGLLNVLGFYDALLAQFDRAVAEGFLKASGRALVASADEPGPLLDQLSVPFEVVEPKWITSGEQT
jgi:uncharacterized protein (TIGR00730 family)